MTDEKEREGGAETLRGALAIVLVGILLGAGYNALGRASRPPRGLEWIKIVRPLPGLEADSSPSDSGGPGAPPSTTPAVPPPATGAPSAAAPPPVGTAGRAAPSHGTPPAAAATPGGADHARPLEEPPLAEPGSPGLGAAGLPSVPDREEPIEVQLALAKRFFDARGALFVDAREASEYAAGHIPGAVSVPFDEAAAKPVLLDPLKRAGRPILVYCEGRDCELSRNLAVNMLAEGIRKVLVFTGGIAEWQAAGYPLARGAGGEGGR